MRPYVLLSGMVVLLAVSASMLVQARAADDVELAAPGELDVEAARPLRTPAFKAIDSEVRLAANGAAPVSTRRTGGMAGRLQSLRSNDKAPAAEEAVAPTRRALQPQNTDEEEVDTDVPTHVVGALPSVLKRNAARNNRTYTEQEVTEAESPSDAAPIEASKPAQPIRTAPSRARSNPPATTTNPGALPETSATTARPAPRSTSLAAGASASLAVDTAGPKAMTIGKPATYVVTVINQGVNEAANVLVAIDLPTHVELSNVSGTVGEANAAGEGPAQRIVWKIDRIAGRGQEKMTLELIPQSNETIDLTVEWTMAPPTTTARIDVLEPKLTMALKGPKDVLFGDTAVYQIIVANPGTGDAEGVTVDLVSSETGAAEAKPLGTITAGQQKIIEVSMTASKAGSMTMHFTAKSGTLLAEATEQVLVRQAHLELSVEGPALVFAGSDATYKVHVRNTGDAAAESVQIGALIPDGSEYLGGIAGVKAKSSQIVWSAGTLAPGASGNYEFTLQMGSAGSFDVQLQSKAGDLLTSASATTKVEAVADLKLTVNDPQGPKPVGEEVTYEVTLVNRGTKAARKVAVVINFSEGIDPISVEGGSAEIGSGQALFSPILSIEAGGTHKLKIKAKASKAGSHVFRAEVRCNDPETRLASEQTTRFFGSGSSTAADAPAAGQFVPMTGAKPMLNKRR